MFSVWNVFILTNSSYSLLINFPVTASVEHISAVGKPVCGGPCFLPEGHICVTCGPWVAGRPPHSYLSNHKGPITNYFQVHVIQMRCNDFTPWQFLLHGHFFYIYMAIFQITTVQCPD